MVSDFDLLALDRMSLVQDIMFPPTDQSWQVKSVSNDTDKDVIQLKLLYQFVCFPIWCISC